MSNLETHRGGGLVKPVVVGGAVVLGGFLVVGFIVSHLFWLVIAVFLFVAGWIAGQFTN